MGWRRIVRRIGAVGAIASTVAAARGAAPPTLDQRLTATVARSRGSTVDRAVGAFTDIGSVYGLLGCSAALAAGGEVRLGLRTAITGSLAWAAAQVTKDLVDRERPYELGTAELLIEVPHGSSWPSGHSAVAVGVAASRLQVGAHHATDTLAGLAIGALTAELAEELLDRVLPELPQEG